MLRREGRDAAEFELFARYGDGIADGENAGVEHADDIARVGLVDDLALGGHELLRLRQAHFLAALHMIIFCVALELAGADAHEGQPVAVGLVHVRLNFEDERGKVRAERVDHAAVRFARQGARRHAQKFLQKRLYAEIGQGRAEEHGRKPARTNFFKVKFAACTEQLHIVDQLLMAALADELRDLRVVQINFHLVRAVLAGHAGEKDQLAGTAVVYALKLPAGAHGPVAGVGFNAELVFQLVQQFKRVARLTVHFVDKGKDRDMAHGADLEELPGLRLDALCAVNDHDGGVRRHERAVGVLGKVLMAGGVEDVDAEALILELHDGRCDRDASLLLDLHPVGYGGTGIFLALDRARLRDGPAVEQEFFCQGRFTGVGVRNDRKRSAPGDLFFQGCHVCSSKFSLFLIESSAATWVALQIILVFYTTGLVYHTSRLFTSGFTGKITAEAPAAPPAFPQARPHRPFPAPPGCRSRRARRRSGFPPRDRRKYHIPGRRTKWRGNTPCILPRAGRGARR